ncbi:MAG TPA: hypothetical protein VGN60_08980 [Devosia sp.]|jgi:hypothetical protein|nr:hypothetical protein [Devosia sp.]
MHMDIQDDGDDGDLVALIAQATDQLAFAGPQARATVRFAVDDQWFSCTLQMIDCPGHVASESDPRVCKHCSTHIDELRP